MEGRSNKCQVAVLQSYPLFWRELKGFLVVDLKLLAVRGNMGLGVEGIELN